MEKGAEKADTPSVVFARVHKPLIWKELRAILAGRCAERVRESLKGKELSGVDAVLEGGMSTNHGGGYHDWVA